MADTYGLTLTGINTPDVDTLRTLFTTALQQQFGASLPLGDDTALGFLTGITAEQIASAWDFAQASWSSLDPNAASGSGLDAVSILSGTFRIPASASFVTETLCGVNGTVVSAGAQFTTLSTGARFASASPAVLSTVSAWVASTLYALGTRVTNSGQVYQVSVAGTSAGSGSGPVVTSGTTTDGTVTWLWIGTGTAAVDVVITCTTTGATVAVSGDLTVIANPLSGLTTAFNILDATVGNAVQSDQDLRLLRTVELAATGTGTANAIRAALLQLSGVTFAYVFYNNTDVTDANGNPPHSVQALVVGGTTSDIVNSLYSQLAAGINSVGSSSGTLVDSMGVTQTINFTRPSSTNIYLRVTLTYDVTQYPGDAATQAALATAGNTRSVGADVVASPLTAAIFTGVAGIFDVSRVDMYTDVIGTPATWATSTAYVATAGSRSVVIADGGRHYICTAGGTSASSGTGPSGTGNAITDGTVTWYYLGQSITIDPFHVAVYDTSRINISSSVGTL